MNLNLSAGNIIAGLLFSGIGFVAFTYGKREERYRTMVMGIVMMVYPYFTPSTTITCVVGAALSVALYFFRD
jgi:uncharacterized oligopeptide transporter (OPT) family protein